MSKENDIECIRSRTEPVKDGRVLAVTLEDEKLQAMGYEQHMKRGFNSWLMTAFCLTGLGLLPSLGGTIWYSLGYLGLVSMTWGWLIGAFFIMFEVFALAELSLSMPTAGGFCALVMILPSKTLGRISNVFLWLSTITFFVLIVALPIYAKENGRTNSVKDMFTASYNQTGWSNGGLVFLLSFLVPCWCISGYDSTAHLAEETENVARVVP
ncbi:hypothetical protein DHEL01_v206658 [Diaporthe helianthi]|uniref:Amino acid permease n=1 Tax=Diaporthe helianthi TaxID=158607 RepID=A0A2P5HXJ7_DIAHE|nr:hypothetical protein DHEL01_v206658 [Diaporthe helianthi]